MVKISFTGFDGPLSVITVIVLSGILFGCAICVIGLVRYVVTRRHNEWCWAGAMIVVSMLAVEGIGILVFSENPQDKSNVVTAFARIAETAIVVAILVFWMRRKYRTLKP